MAARIFSEKEEKLKKAFEKCGLCPIDASTIILGKQEKQYFMNDAAMFKIKNTDSYLVFGQPMDYTHILRQLQETSKKDPAKFKELLKQNMKDEERVIDGDAESGDLEETAKAVEDLSICADGQNEDDVNLLMAEARITREEAIKALFKANNDVIQALVDLHRPTQDK